MEQLTDRLLPKDPGKRDIAIILWIVVPLVVLGVIWGTVGNFSEDRPPATVPPGYHPASPTASPSANHLFELIAA